MLRDESIEIEGQWSGTVGTDDGETGYSEWQDVDRELRSIARRQSGLDAELMRSLREAERVRLWREVGCASMMEYLERVFGYSPRVAQERLRTARKLENLPELEDALAQNELPFSAVRELSRIATPQTQSTWRGAARGKCLREIEEMVSGLAEGDLPDSRKKPELERCRLSYEDIETATRALERRARQALDQERGERLDDNAFMAALFQLALAGASGEHGVGGRPKYQIVLYHCESCEGSKQLGDGRKLDVDETVLERAECDAERVSLDAPGRVTQEIPAKVRRFVDLRDGKRCRMPGCRSTCNLEVHHIKHREDGGTHDPENLVTLCDSHHGAYHRGALWLGGTSSALVVRRHDQEVASSSIDDRHAASSSADVGARAAKVDSSQPARAAAVTDARPPCRAKPVRPRSRFAEVENRTLACGALKRLGWKLPIASKAVDAVLAESGPEIPLEDLIRTALQRCSD